MKRFWTFIGVLIAVAVMVAGCSDEKEKSKRDRKSRIEEDLTLTKSQKANSVSNMKQILMGCSAYSFDNDDWTPASLDLTKTYVGDNTKVFIAPFDKKSRKSSGTIGAEKTTYAYLLAGKNIKISTIGAPSSTPVLIEKPWLLPREEDTIRVGYADGHVSEVKIKDVSKMSCSEVVRFLTKDVKGKPEIISLLLQNAEKEDNRK